MKQPIKSVFHRLAYSVFLWAVVLFAITGLVIWSYYSVNFGNSGTLAIDTSRGFAADEIFKNNRRRTKCVRSDYIPETRDLCNVDSCVIYFSPVSGKSAVCPIIAATVDRRTGDVSISEQ
jgi:uncharacterized protein (UPF0333 family)